MGSGGVLGDLDADLGVGHLQVDQLGLDRGRQPLRGLAPGRRQLRGEVLDLGLGLLELACRFLALLIGAVVAVEVDRGDRKSTRLNSSHVAISYAVFSLKKNTR